jgi:hypothetical protein
MRALAARGQLALALVATLGPLLVTSAWAQADVAALRVMGADASPDGAAANATAATAADAPVGLAVSVDGRPPLAATRTPGLAPWLLLEPGRHRVALHDAVVTDEGAILELRARLALVDVDLEPGSLSTLVYGGDGEATTLVRDDLAHLPAAGQASVRIVHAAADAGALTIELRRQGPHAVTAGPAPAARGRDAASERDADATPMAWALAAHAAGERQEVPGDRYVLVVTGHDTPATILGPLELYGGVAYTLAITSPTPGTLATALAIDAAMPDPPPTAGTASLRFVHLSPDTPLVDVAVSGRPTFRDVEFGRRTPTVALEPGRHEVRVYPHRPPRRAQEALAGGAVTATPIEPLVRLVDLAAGSVTTLVLSGAYEPPVAEGGRGHLSIQVQPSDARIVLEGPRGYHDVLQGDQFLVGLEPGPYRAEVSRDGFVTATYETDVAADVTSLVTITLQEGEEGAPSAPLTIRQPTWRGVELQRYTEGAVPLPAIGHALVRVVHTAATVPAIDVDVARAADDAEASVLVAGLPYPNASRYVAVEAGDVDLVLRVGDSASVLHALRGVAILPGTTYTLFVTADPVTNLIWLVPLVEAVMLMHDVRSAPR